MTFPMKTKLIALLFTAASLAAAENPIDTAASALARRDFATAESILTPIAQTGNPDARVFYHLSQIRLQQGRAKEAVDFAQKAANAAPTDPMYQSHLGMALSVRIGEVNFLHQGLLAGRMRGAFEKSIELDANHVPGYIGLARYYTNAPAIVGGGREPAERYARALETRVPQLGTLELARIAERFEDPAAALALYQKAATVQPNDAGIQESLGRVSEALQHLPEAQAFYEKALALDPNRERVKTALARIASNGS